MLLDTFSKVRSVACNLHYCGTLSMEEAARQIKQHLPLEEVSIPSNSPYIRDLMTYDKPTVVFYGHGGCHAKHNLCLYVYRSVEG